MAIKTNSKFISIKMKVLVILTNTEQVQNEKTGFDVKELAYIHNSLKKKMEFDYATPLGGNAPVDPQSLVEDPLVKQFMIEEKSKLEKTLMISKLNEKEYGMLILPGGAGSLYDER